MNIVDNFVNKCCKSTVICEKWPALYKLGILSVLGMIISIFAIKGRAFYSISEAGLFVILLVLSFKSRKAMPLPQKNVLVAFAFFAGGMLLSSIYQGELKNILVSLDYLYMMMNFFLIYIGVCCFRIDNVLYKAITVGSIICAIMLLMTLSDPKAMIGGRFWGWNNPNVTVQELAMLVPFIVVSFYKLKGNMLWRVVNIFALLTIVIFFGLTGSRGGVSGLIVGILVMVGLYWPIVKSKWSDRKKIAVSVAMGVIVSSLALIVAVTVFSRTSSDMSRVHRMQAAYQMFLENPVAGVGRENFNNEYQKNIKNIKEASKITKEDKNTHAHNDVVHLLATTGVMGTVGYVAFSIIIWYILMRNIISNKRFGFEWAMMVAMISLYVHGLVDLCILQRSLAKEFFCMLGITLAINDIEYENNTIQI